MKNPIPLAYFMLFIAPAFFTTNVVFGRLLVSVEPFTLAFLRWAIASTILLIVCRTHWATMWAVFRNNVLFCFVAAFFAFWICGGVVYFALKETTATNGTLIYTTPPVLILIMDAVWRGRAISSREVMGILLAIFGVVVIIARGNIENLLLLNFNSGDLLFVAAAIAWAFYSVMLKSPRLSSLDTVPLLAMLATSGSCLLLPFAITEIVSTGNFPSTSFEWGVIAAIVLLSSLLSFSTFQYGIKILGSSIAGIFMYLLPPWGLYFAWALLGETMEQFHTVGTILIMAGIIVATLPTKLFKGLV